MAKILFILTSYDRMLDGEQTGLWLEEHAVPYLALTAAGHAVTVSSVSGGTVPVDPRSYPEPAQAAEWSDAVAELRRTPAFQALDPDNFDAVYIPGGHGTVFDMPYNMGLHRLLLRFQESGRVVGCVCHAPAVFVGMRAADGTPFVAGRRIAAFTDEEERAVDGVHKVPFLLEERLRQLGARVEAAPAWSPNAIQDGRLITGQNPQSSRAVASLMLGALGS